MSGPRRVDPRFIAAMNRKLDRGRAKGRTSYDEGWSGESLPERLLDCLQGEFDELVEAVCNRDGDTLLDKAADVANFALFVADACGALGKHEPVKVRPLQRFAREHNLDRVVMIAYSGERNQTDVVSYGEKPPDKEAAAKMADGIVESWGQDPKDRREDFRVPGKEPELDP